MIFTFRMAHKRSWLNRTGKKSMFCIDEKKKTRNKCCCSIFFFKKFFFLKKVNDKRASERTFERSTILRNNSHQTKSKLCAEWTMKVSILQSLFSLLSLPVVCICVYRCTRTFKRPRVTLLFRFSRFFFPLLRICFLVVVLCECIGACIALRLSVAFVLCSVANLMCYWNQFDFFFLLLYSTFLSSTRYE